MSGYPSLEKDPDKKCNSESGLHLDGTRSPRVGDMVGKHMD